MTYVYFFGAGRAEGGAGMKELLGGKGAGLAEMTNLGIPVPPGFTISTDCCRRFYADGSYPPELEGEVDAALARVEQLVGRRFGDPADPLLVSVRSGARASMPGMMDTVLNLGLSERTVEGLIRRTGDARFAYDSYRRFVQMYGDVVMGLKPESAADEDPFEELLERKKQERRARLDTDLAPDDLRQLVGQYKEAIQRRLGRPFPEEPREQLWGAIKAVFGSWNNKRANTYRRLHGIPGDWGTAVNVQAMVFGNMGDDCATGVAFTRDPSTGERRFFGEYLVNAQGEDVVAGTRTPAPLDRVAAARKGGSPDARSLEERMPEAYRELARVYETLERHYRDMQDIEFTIERGKVWLLQTRSGKRAARAMVRIAVEMVAEGLIDRATALMRVDPEKITELLLPVLEPAAKQAAAATGRRVAMGLPASPGGAVGKVVFDADEAEARAAKGEDVILVRVETSPEDIHGMKAARGILTARGGMTSHAAVVGRGMGKCCVVGCSEITVDYQARELRNRHGAVVRAGEVVSLDGTSGEVFRGAVPTVPAPPIPELATVLGWADEVRRLRVRANADTPADATAARAFGAEGIGLCRTEHMFFAPERILAVRQMILSPDEAGRRRALDKIVPMQREDFAGIFRAMGGLPVTIRLLDPPLHEFLPHREAELEAVAHELGVSVAEVRARNEELHEANPMLGHRGCRLAITFPEIYEAQVRAVIEAACAVQAEGCDVRPELMIPIVGDPEELRKLRALCERAAAAACAAAGRVVPHPIGTMIELPRACLVAGRIAEHADFFSFGTNDLTQTTYGLSRDDVGRFLPAYLEQGIYLRDPFVALDRDGVGSLMRLGVAEGRRARPGLKIGICGEHGGEPSSVEFCHRLELDYVSCSPFRVPVARVAAAQAALSAGAAAG